MADPSTILGILQFVETAAMAVCQAIDKVIELKHEERQALKELRKGVESLKSDTLVYKDLLNTMVSDTDLDRRSPYARFIRQYVNGLRSSSYIHRANYLQYHRTDGKEAMESLERALKATRLLLEDPAGNHQEITVNPSVCKKPRRALNSVLNVLKANFQPGDHPDLIGELTDATYEIFVCQQNNERAFKLVWNLYVVAQQWTGCRGSVEDIGNIQDHGEAPDSVLHAPHIHPFAVSPEGDSRVNPLRPPPIMTDPSTILGILQLVGTAAMSVCDAVGKEIELEHEERQALKELHEGIESLKSGTLVYKDLLNTMERDADLDGRSPYARFIQRYAMGLRSSSYVQRANDLQYHRTDGKEAMESLERALKATRLLLEEDPAGNRQEITVNPSEYKKPRRALNFVLNVLKANFRPGHRHELTSDLKDATSEILVCQQNNEHAFKLVCNLYAVAQQWSGRRFSIDNIGNTQDHVGQALGSVLHAFHIHPFAVSSEGDSRINLPTFAILNHNHETATRHEQLARRMGKAWVDDRVRKSDTQVRDIVALQTSLFELLWSGTVEQLKRHSVYSSDDPERPEFERAVEELERALQETIVRSKKQRFTIAFCGMVKAGKSLFLNALMGRAILPSDGESANPCTPHTILSITTELPSTAWPCRLRHVEGQTVPELQFQAHPFLVVLRKLQTHQYGRKMQTYQPPPENMFEALLSDSPSEPSDEEVLLRTIHSQWIDLHAATRDNLLKFETPGFKLPPMATGEQNVKTLVSFMSGWIALFSTKWYFQLGQLNDIVRLCQRFDLKFDMSEVDWPLLTVEFNSLRGHKMDGIYEVGLNTLTVFPNC